MSMSKQVSKQSRPKEVKVFLMGKIGAGKTALMNNLFDLEQDDKIIIGQSTTECITKESVRNGTKLVLTDTVGMPMETHDKKVQLLKDLTKYLEMQKNEPHLFFYCIPVDPSTKFDESNPAIMKTLQDAFGRKIWNHCKLVFTFSNIVRDNFKNKRNDNEELAKKKFKECLNDYAIRFEQELKKLDVRDIIVRTTFNRDETSKSQIIAIPAGVNSEDEVFTGITNEDGEELSWVEAIFAEIGKGELKTIKLKVRDSKAKAGAKGLLPGVGGGAALGGAGGAAFGLVLGPVGMVVGAAIGAVAGGVAGAVAGVGAGVGVKKLDNHLDDKKAEKKN